MIEEIIPEKRQFLSQIDFGRVRAKRRPAYNEPSSEETAGLKNNLDTGGGRKETAREEIKREEADRKARYVAD